MFTWVGNLTHLYLTSLCCAVNYYVSNFDNSLKHGGADGYILGVSEGNIPNRFGEDSKINFDFAWRQRVNHTIALNMSDEGENKRDER